MFLSISIFILFSQFILLMFVLLLTISNLVFFIISINSVLSDFLFRSLIGQYFLLSYLFQISIVIFLYDFYQMIHLIYVYLKN